MADADSMLDILIRLGVIGQADVQAANDLLKQTGSAATGTAAAATKLGEANEEGAKHAEHAGLSHRELHQVLHLIASESGPAAGAAIAGGAAVAMGSIGILVMAARELREVFTQNAERLKELDDTIAAGLDNEAFTKGLDDLKTALYGTREESDKFEESLRKIESAEESLLEKSQGNITAIKNEMAADLAKSAAKKQALIEEIKLKEITGDLTKAQAESALADLESKSEQEANARKQKARKDEIEELKKAQQENRDAAAKAVPDARAADAERQQAETNTLRQKNLVEQARAALDESKKGSVASDLKEKEEAYEKQTVTDRMTPTAANLRMEIAALQKLKDQAQGQVDKYSGPEAEHATEEKEKGAKKKAAEAEERALSLEKENQTLAKKIRDLEEANSATTSEENTTSQYHDRARTDATAGKDVARAQQDIEQITRLAQKHTVEPADIAAAHAAVNDLATTMGELRGLVKALGKLGDGNDLKELKRTVAHLEAQAARTGY